jgi:hypothetical protein
MSSFRAEFQLKCLLTDRTVCQFADLAQFQILYDEMRDRINGAAGDSASPSQSSPPSSTPSLVPVPTPPPSPVWWWWIVVVAGAFALSAVALAACAACALRRRHKARSMQLHQSSAVHDAHVQARAASRGSHRSSRYSSLHPVVASDGAIAAVPSAPWSPLNTTSRPGAREVNAYDRIHAGYDMLRLASQSRSGSRVQLGASAFERTRSSSASSARLPVRKAGYDSPAAALAAPYDTCNAAMTSQSALGGFVRPGYIAAASSQRL